VWRNTLGPGIPSASLGQGAGLGLPRREVGRGQTAAATLGSRWVTNSQWIISPLWVSPAGTHPRWGGGGRGGIKKIGVQKNHFTKRGEPQKNLKGPGEAFFKGR